MPLAVAPGEIVLRLDLAPLRGFGLLLALLLLDVALFRHDLLVPLACGGAAQFNRSYISLFTDLPSLAVWKVSSNR